MYQENLRNIQSENEEKRFKIGKAKKQIETQTSEMAQLVNKERHLEQLKHKYSNLEAEMSKFFDDNE